MQAGAFVAGCVVVVIFVLMCKYTFNVDKTSGQIAKLKNEFNLKNQKVDINDISVAGTVASYFIHGVGVAVGFAIMWNAANNQF